VSIVATTTVLATAAGAAPPEVTCGSLLTVDTRLTQDLTCTGPGLRLAPDVTLDLRGHALTGTAGATGVEVASAGAATVRNGSLVGWGTGIATYDFFHDEFPADTSGPLTVNKVQLRDGGVGLDVSGDSGTGAGWKPTAVTRSTFTRLSGALVNSWFNTSVTVDRSTFVDNRVAARTSNGVIDISHSDFLRNGTAIFIYEGNTHVDDSRFTDNGSAVRLGGVGSATVTNSRLVGGDVALDAAGPVWFSLSGNRFSASTVAVRVRDGASAFVTANTFYGNGTGLQLLGQPSDLSRVIDNRFVLNGDGIYVDPGDPLIELGGNDVRRSSGWGIYAPGVTDLGGNTAVRNGNSPQCVGVVCAPVS
jgi:hypothetical protein